jgi:hypothetical protein
MRGVNRPVDGLNWPAGLITAVVPKFISLSSEVIHPVINWGPQIDPIE